MVSASSGRVGANELSETRPSASYQLGVVVQQGKHGLPVLGGQEEDYPVRAGVFQTNFDGTGQLGLNISGASIGATDYYQVVFRDDRHPDDTGIGLTNAMKVTYVP